jgi:endoglucanase
MQNHNDLIPIRATRSQINLLRKLTEAVAVSGDEASVRDIVRSEISSHVDQVWTDSIGNLLAIRQGKGRSRLKIMLAAHMDEIGVMIVNIDSKGGLKFETVGGLDPRQLPGKPVWIGSEKRIGLIGAKPVHLTTSEERQRVIDVDNLFIDIAAHSKDAAQGKVKVGDRATFATPFNRIGNSITAKALDNRLGVASLIELCRYAPANIDLLAAFTVQEEVGLRGARVAAQALKPDAAIALDCTPANDLPTWDGSENASFNSKLDLGAAIYIADRATLSHPGLIHHFIQTAEAEEIPYQIRQPGGGGTDAGAIHLTDEGVPSLSLSVPARYLHTANSLARLTDWRASVRLTYSALSRLKRSVLEQHQ